MSNQAFNPDPRYQQAQEPTEQLPYPQQAYRNEPPVHQPAYVPPQQQPYAGTTGGQIERREEVYNDTVQRRAVMRYWAVATIYFLLSLLEIVLILRFAFRLLGANAGNGFVQGLYDFSHVFVAPFTGIFGDPALLNQAHVFEVSTLIAMLIYALVAWALIALSRVIFGPTLSNRRSYVTERQRMRE